MKKIVLCSLLCTAPSVALRAMEGRSIRPADVSVVALRAKSEALAKEEAAMNNEEPMDVDHDLVAGVIANDLDRVREALHEGAYLGYADDLGRTPLYIAVRDGFFGMAQLLIENGADINRVDNEGRTPLFIAATKGYLGMIELLLDHSADVNRADNEGFTPLDAAERGNHAQMIALLEHVGAHRRPTRMKGIAI